jgi:hypothetical protein
VLTEGPAEAILRSLTGKVISRLEQVLYVGPDGKLDESDTQLELHFSDGSMVHLDSGLDGNAPTVTTTAWIDPLKPPLSEINARYVAESGKWTKFDVSKQARISRFVGATITRSAFEADPMAPVNMCVIRTEVGSILARLGPDELHVTFELSKA